MIKQASPGGAHSPTPDVKSQESLPEEAASCVAIHITLQNLNTTYGGSNMIDAGRSDRREEKRGVRESIWLSKKSPKKLQDDWKQLTNMNLKNPHSKSSALH